MTYTVSAEVVGVGMRAHLMSGAQTREEAIERFSRAHPGKTILKLSVHRSEPEEKPAPEARQKREDRGAILELMADGRERTATDVANALGISPQQAGSYLNDLVRAGRVKSIRLNEGVIWRVA